MKLRRDEAPNTCGDASFSLIMIQATLGIVVFDTPNHFSPLDHVTENPSVTRATMLMYTTQKWEEASEGDDDDDDK